MKYDLYYDHYNSLRASMISSNKGYLAYKNSLPVSVNDPI